MTQTEPFLRRLPGRPSIDALIATVGAITGSVILGNTWGFASGRPWWILAPPPVLVFESTEDSWTLRKADGTIVDRGKSDPLLRLDSWIRELGLGQGGFVDRERQPPFSGGLVGFYGYDLAPRIEKLPRRAGQDSSLPDLRFGLHDVVVTSNPVGIAQVWGTPFPGIEGDLEARATSLFDRFEAIDRPDVSESRLTAPKPEIERDAYETAVGKALEYIAAGDIFQVNLSQRFTAEGAADPLDLFQRLRMRSPAPYSALLRWDDKAVISASPELFFETRNERIVTKPIKGTRPRGKNPLDDLQLGEQLRSSPKDRAELTMIVDLERNDLGRICEYGSVRVVEAANIESFAQVHHLVATIEGRLRPEIGPIDVIRAVFPGGSITGAPKIRAMEIIDELEPNRRSLYTGAIGYYGKGTSSFNIAIRTILVDGDRVSYQVGGGIVADSDPSAEYEETMHKGRGMFEILSGEGHE